MLNIVLPMAGRGSRFAKAGYSVPKPFIDVCGKPMIQRVVENLRPQCEHRFIFICQKDHLVKFDGERLLKNLTKDPVIIGIDYITDGQLSSALLAREFIENDDPLMTANTDQYIDFDVNDYLSLMSKQALDGLIMTMKADDPKWSFVKLSESTGLVEETAEKKVISDQATVGIYNFAKGRDFCWAADSLIKKDLRVNGEFYICPLYNELISVGKRIGAYNIGSERAGMYGLGIPADLDYFLTTPIANEMRGKR